jgi:hypothetical protein
MGMPVSYTNLKGAGMADPNQMKNTLRILLPGLQQRFR